ncbi:MAG: MlaD family protein [Nitrospirae bacterium]|nr:MlaD family protein [Nitrospirota bacterium]MCL5422666.1 MlaD family protein [Nitrospirota bacterium]
MFDMKKQLMWSKLKVGVVITLALITLFFTVFFAGGIENILSPKVEVQAQIHDVKGLRKGAPVWLSGIEIGSVKEIHLHPQYGAVITLSVKKSAMQYVKKDSRASVLTMGLLGDKYVELSAGTSEAGAIQRGDMITGAAQLELKDVMEVGTVSIQKMSDFIKKLDNLLTKIEKGEGTVTKFLTDPALYDNLRDATKSLSLTLKDIRDARGTVKLLVEDPSLYNNLLAASASFEELSRTMNNSSGTLKKLAEDPALYNKLVSATAAIDTFSVKLNSIIETVDKGEGVAGSLVRDKELASDLKATVAELKELIKNIKEDPKKYFKFSVF